MLIPQVIHNIRNNGKHGYHGTQYGDAFRSRKLAFFFFCWYYDTRPGFQFGAVFDEQKFFGAVHLSVGIDDKGPFGIGFFCKATRRINVVVK